jgi:DNA-binding NarL/FixJ family response regulator
MLTPASFPLAQEVQPTIHSRKTKKQPVDSALPTQTMFLLAFSKSNCWWGRRRTTPSLFLPSRRQERRLSASSKGDAVNEANNDRFLQRNNQWVVLVDDEEAIRLAVGDFLYNQGYQVTACADADSLFKVLETADDDKRLPDAIISDIRMPLSNKNGYELVEAIRSVPKWSAIPVVMLTAKGMTQDRVQGYRVGADAFLPKPFDPNELLSILDNVITRSKQRGQGSRTGDGKESKQNNEPSSTAPELLALKHQLEEIKVIMERNAANTVQKTNVVLTDNEMETLRMLCDGCTYVEIAQDRGVSVNSVNRTVQKLYEMTETKTRTELVKWAVQVGYIK